MVGDRGSNWWVLEIAGDGLDILVAVRDQAVRGRFRLKERAARIVICVIRSSVFALKNLISVCKVESESWGRILGVYHGRQGRKLLCSRHFRLSAGIGGFLMMIFLKL